MATKRQKPAMLGTRISPKAQYGLRLLSRVQGRTIAEAVEWSINLAMRSTRVGASIMETRLATIVDLVWDMPSEAQQVYYLDKSAPELLEFDQRCAWGLVKRCDELWTVSHYDFISEADDPDVMPLKIQVETSAEASFSEAEPRFTLIEKHWETIKTTGAKLVQGGDLETRFTLDQILSGEALKQAGLT